MRETGFPAYTTATGWIGYSDEMVRKKAAIALKEGFDAFKIKVGSANLQDDIKRARVMREAVGEDCVLMMDANSVWTVPQAIDSMRQLAKFRPYWIEEPTSPDDVCGHAKIQAAISKFDFETIKGLPRGCQVATGEQISNKIIHKQYLQLNGYGILQTDIVRLAGISEYLVVALMNEMQEKPKPICLHAGGVGLCNMAAHVCILDYILLGSSLSGRYTEYIDHLQEHFTEPLVFKNAKYIAPTGLGLGLEMKAETLDEYEYPNGRYWSSTEQLRKRFYGDFPPIPIATKEEQK